MPHLASTFFKASSQPWLTPSLTHITLQPTTLSNTHTITHPQPQINEMQAAADAAKPPTDIGKGSVSPPSSASSRSGMRLLFTRRYLPQLVMATVIPAAQQLTGINSIM